MNRDENLKAEQFHTVSPNSDFSEDIRKEIERSIKKKKSCTIPNITVISSYIIKF